MQNFKLINKRNLIHNINYCKQSKKQIMAMVKADAYGHGMEVIAKTLKSHVKHFGVANCQEALKLRSILPKHNILVVGKSKKYKQLILNNIEITVDDIYELYKINRICKKINKLAYVHIAVNTGMNRLGVKNIFLYKKMIKYIDKNELIVLNGIFTHMFDADKNNSNYDNQIKIFDNYVNEIKDKNILIHIGGSFCLNHSIPKYVNMVRVGLFLYGYGNKTCKKVMSIESRIIKITDCSCGEHIGYGKTQVTKNIKVGLIPIGYADGIYRKLFRSGYVKINGKNCKIVGNICMDMFMIDLSNVKAKVGDKVIVMNNATTFSKKLQTSEYEILTSFIGIRAKTKII